MLADTVGKLDQPMDRLEFQRRQVWAVPQAMSRLPEFGPATKEVDEVADLRRLALPVHSDIVVVR